MPTHVQQGMALNDRERQVLVLVAKGRTDIQIARDIGKSVETTKRAMHQLRTKLGASNRAHAVAIGFAKGYLSVITSSGGGK